MATRTAQAAIGTLLIATTDGVVRQEQSARQPGSTVTVRDLFANVPVRRKFLEGRVLKPAG